MIEPVAHLPDPAALPGNDPNPVMILIFGGAFLVAVVWNLYAYYKLFTLDHVKREMAIKRKLRAFGLLDPGDD